MDNNWTRFKKKFRWMKKNHPEVIIKDVITRLRVIDCCFGECRVESSYISFSKEEPNNKTITVPFLENDNGEVRSTWFVNQNGKTLSTIQLIEFEIYGKEDLI